MRIGNPFSFGLPKKYQFDAIISPASVNAYPSHIQIAQNTLEEAARYLGRRYGMVVDSVEHNEVTFQLRDGLIVKYKIET